MHTFLLSAENWYLVCFGVGLVLSVLAFVGGFGHLHFGHLHLGHIHAGHAHGGHLHTHAAHGGHDSNLSPFNGFTLPAPSANASVTRTAPAPESSASFKAASSSANTRASGVA